MPIWVQNTHLTEIHSYYHFKTSYNVHKEGSISQAYWTFMDYHIRTHLFTRRNYHIEHFIHTDSYYLNLLTKDSEIKEWEDPESNNAFNLVLEIRILLDTTDGSYSNSFLSWQKLWLQSSWRYSLWPNALHWSICTTCLGLLDTLLDEASHTCCT